MRKRISLNHIERENIYADILLPDNYTENISTVYINTAFLDEMEKISEWMSGQKYGLISIGGFDWNQDMSPWKAERVFKSEEDFSGGADRYLEILRNNIIPVIEKELDIIPARRGIAGYSLSGLFALYSIFKTSLFCAVGSISGSLWFDNWLNYISENELKSSCPIVYFSLGDQEKNARNLQMATVEENTRQTTQILKEKGAEVFFEFNPGNHFTDVEERIIKGIKWIFDKWNKSV